MKRKTGGDQIQGHKKIEKGKPFERMGRKVRV